MSEYKYEQALLALSAMNEAGWGEPMTRTEADEYVQAIQTDSNYHFKEEA